MNQTPEEYVANTGQTCPFCGEDSDNFDYGAYNGDGEIITQAITCNECEGEWSDVFKLVNIYIRYTPDKYKEGAAA